MAVCNLFDNLKSNSGNFLLFSQYVEDITKNYGESDNWKVVPTKFVALNIDYNKIRTNHQSIVLPRFEEFNEGIPKYFQNVFENGCAYCREHTEWTPDISRNIFWNCMYEGGFITPIDYLQYKTIKEIMYYGDITLHSYNEHKGMGYGEIYCYIPTDAQKMNCQYISNISTNTNREFISNTSTTLEGLPYKEIDDYKQTYYINKDFTLSFDSTKDTNTNEELVKLPNDVSITKYNVNTIILLYSIFKKVNNDWIIEYESIPMGIYFTGMIENDGKVNNTITKYVTTSYGTGTSYGLRICTRFTATSQQGILKNTEIIVDNSDYTNICQLMSAMNENLDRMLDVTKSATNTSQHYKDLLSIIKNNRTNVPYVKTINGVSYWFVNGKMVSAVSGNINSDDYQKISTEALKQRIENLLDNDTTNDYDKVYSENEIQCSEEELENVANVLEEIAKEEGFEYEWIDNRS